MSNIWYINANSTSEDGLTPNTGYHNYTNLSTAVILTQNDTVNFVNNGTVDDSVTDSVTIPNSIILQSYTPPFKPNWIPPKEIAVIDATSFNLNNIVLAGTTTLSINGSINDATDPTCTNIQIQKCDFSTNCSLIIYGITSGSIINNIFRNVSKPPIILNSNTGDIIPDINGVAINNNTFYNIKSYCIGLWAFCDVSNFRILNNIFQTASGRLFFNITGNTSNILIDSNIDYNAPEWAYLASTDFIGPSNIHNTDPLLKDPANGDFTLQSNSPCIDRGNSNDPTLPVDDFIGTSRPQSTYYDIGAYEYIFPIPPLPPVVPDLTVYPLYAPPNPTSGQTYTDQLGNQYTYNGTTKQWDKYNTKIDLTTASSGPIFYPGYRLQEEDLNVSFCAQGVAYPQNLAYFYTPYNLSYEIDFYTNDRKLVPYGSRTRVPEIVTQGVYRANFIVGYDWPTGYYNIVWSYQTSLTGPVQTITNTFQVLNSGYRAVQFIYFYCNNDLPATFMVLPEAFDLPASFTIVP